MKIKDAESRMYPVAMEEKDRRTVSHGVVRLRTAPLLLDLVTERL